MVEPVVKYKETGEEWDLFDLVDDDYLESCADLSEFEVSGVPVIPNINTAILEAIQNGGKLDMRNWHNREKCGTTHCIAGWAVHLAGKAGYELEALVPMNGDGDSTPVAAALIFAASGWPIIPDFFDNNEDALSALKARAAKEQAG
jgi:hypothetical protein